MKFPKSNRPSGVDPIEGGHQLRQEFYELLSIDYAVFEFQEIFGLNGLWYWNPANTWNRWASGTFWKMMGYSPFDQMNRSAICQSIIRANNLQLLMSDDSEIENDQDELPVKQIICKTKNGNTLFVQWVMKRVQHPVLQETRMLAGFSVKEDSITRELNRNSHLKLLIEKSVIGTWEWNVNTGETIFNKQWAQIIGYELEELAPISIDTWLKYSHPDDLEVSRQAVDDYFSGKTDQYVCNIRMKHKDGHWVWVRDSGKIISRNHKGEPEWMVGTRLEITKQKKNLDQYSLFIENAPSAIAMLDTNLCYLAHSKKWLSDYGVKESSLIGRSHYEIFPEIPQRWKDDHRKCLKGEVLRSEEDYFIRKDGKLQYTNWELHPWYDDGGEVGGIIMMTSDITKIKEAEVKLRISEERFRSSFENAAAGMVIVDLNGMFLEVNNTFCELMGYNPDELLSTNFLDITHKDDLEEDRKAMKYLKEGTIPFTHLQKRYIHKNGEHIQVVLSVSMVRNEFENPLYYVAQILDVTPMVKTQKALQQTLAKLEAILEASSEVSIIGTDTEGKIILFNKGAENLLGYTRSEVIGILTPDVFHDELEKEIQLKELIKEGWYPKTMHDIFSTKILEDGFYTQEFTYIEKHGKKIPVLLTITAIKEEGKVVGYLKVAVNIEKSKQKEAEINKLLEVTKDQNERLKNFAHIVSHNMRSHTGNLQMLLNLYREEETNEGREEILKLLNSASISLSQTIEHLNEIVQINTTVEENMVSIGLQNMLIDVLGNLSYITSDNNFNIISSISSKIKVTGVHAYVESIFLNMLTNSFRYKRHSQNSFIKITASIKGAEVLLEFKDNGLGIDLEKHGDRLFGMYKTFHQHEQSRGIGLFITKNQVEAMGGRIEVESENNKGTTFKIYLKNGEN
ncbi:PAS domain S-box protein [Ascidiimonas sp. W6]|uniref:PAS domain S-box protein n=1 Tax=Ascidiimonas meishanensis TaxID=3128903 RepID=UPI0030EF455D